MYEGIIDQRQMEPNAKRAYNILSHQRSRCSNKSNKSYAYYGQKGIRVSYETREFIGWYLDNLKYWKGTGLPDVGRIDHNKNYSFDNIEFQTRSENTIDRNNRYGNPSVKAGKRVRIISHSGLIIDAANEHDAERFLSLGHGHVRWLIKTGKIKKGYRFQHIEQGVLS